MRVVIPERLCVLDSEETGPHCPYYHPGALDRDGWCSQLQLPIGVWRRPSCPYGPITIEMDVKE